MTIGRIDDPESPLEPVALGAVGLFGTGSRIPSGPAVMMPRRQAEHMIAIDPPVRILFEALEPKGPFSNRVPPVNSPFACFKAVWTEFPSANTSKRRYFPNNRHNGASTACQAASRC